MTLCLAARSCRLEDKPLRTAGHVLSAVRGTPGRCTQRGRWGTARGRHPCAVGLSSHQVPISRRIWVGIYWSHTRPNLQASSIGSSLTCIQTHLLSHAHTHTRTPTCGRICVHIHTPACPCFCATMKLEREEKKGKTESRNKDFGRNDSPHTPRTKMLGDNP